MPDPRTVELLARALTNAGIELEIANLVADRVIVDRDSGLLIVPADTVRTGWLHEGDDGNISARIFWPESGFDFTGDTRYIVAPDPRTEATDG